MQPLQVTPNGHYLQRADGAPFFWLGDTAWKLGRLSPADVERYLANRASKGFNVVQMDAIGARPNYAGEMPFEGPGKPWPQAVLNERYWQHVDYILDAACKHGLYVALLAWWGNAADDTFCDPVGHNYRYGRALGTRYADRPNLIWVGAGEYHKPNMWTPPLSEQHLTHLTRLIDGIRDTDTGQHLIAMHPLSFLSSSEEFHNEPWLAFNMVQTHVYPSYIRHLILGDWQRTPAKPTLSSEPWYEGEEALYERRARIQRRAGDRYDAAWIQRYQAYWSVFSGSFGYTYGHMNLWCMHPTPAYWLEPPGTIAELPGVLLQSALDAPGSAHLRHLKTLIESKPMLERIPDPGLVSLNTRGHDATLSPNLRCATRAADGSWAFLYSTRGEVIRVAMSRLAGGQMNATWYDPRTGGRGPAPDRAAIPSGPGAPDRYFAPPGQPADANDWVLVLEP